MERLKQTGADLAGWFSRQAAWIGSKVSWRSSKSAATTNETMPGAQTSTGPAALAGARTAAAAGENIYGAPVRSPSAVVALANRIDGYLDIAPDDTDAVDGLSAGGSLPETAAPADGDLSAGTAQPAVTIESHYDDAQLADARDAENSNTGPNLGSSNA